jgi:hypothetical protein
MDLANELSIGKQYKQALATMCLTQGQVRSAIFATEPRESRY